MSPKVKLGRTNPRAEKKIVRKMLRTYSAVLVHDKNESWLNYYSKPKSLELAIISPIFNKQRYFKKKRENTVATEYTRDSAELLRTLLKSAVEYNANLMSSDRDSTLKSAQTSFEFSNRRAVDADSESQHSGAKVEKNLNSMGEERPGCESTSVKIKESEMLVLSERPARSIENEFCENKCRGEKNEHEVEILQEVCLSKTQRDDGYESKRQEPPPSSDSFRIQGSSSFTPIKAEAAKKTNRSNAFKTSYVETNEGKMAINKKAEGTFEKNENSGMTRKRNLTQTEEKTRIPSLGSHYDEIIRLLQTIDDAENCGQMHEERSLVTHEETLSSAVIRQFDQNRGISDLNSVHSLLDAMEKESDALIRNSSANNCGGDFKKGDKSTPLSPRLEELMDRDPLALAHEILSLKIQIEDQRKGIHLLREALSDAQEKNASSIADHQGALDKANAEAETLVRRHQKFIQQLLREKRELNETITKLIDDLKLQEEKFKKNVKALEERHQMDLKRVKETQALADKMKRGKWMEMKTQKIKEMTVKGLEPELSRIAIQQRQEIAELKNIQRMELEAAELRATRRASELMDDMRADLLKEKAAAVERETKNLRIQMEKNFEDERNRLEATHQKLKEELREREERMAYQEAEFRQKILDIKRGVNEEKDNLRREFHEKMEEMRFRHLDEIKQIREEMEREKENWTITYKKKESEKYREMETELVKRFKRERDRDIEMVVNALEKETARLEMEMNEQSDGKLQRLREKFEKEIKEAEAKESALREQLGEIKCKLTAKEESIAELNDEIQRRLTECEALKKRCDEMISEKKDLKNIIRKEFEADISDVTKEKELLEEEIFTLKKKHRQELTEKDQINAREKAEMQKELAKVYNRIKMVARKKEMVIEALQKENQARVERCSQLEMLLEKQRKNLLLH